MQPGEICIATQIVFRGLCGEFGRLRYSAVYRCAAAVVPRLPLPRGNKYRAPHTRRALLPAQVPAPGDGIDCLRASPAAACAAVPGMAGTLPRGPDSWPYTRNCRHVVASPLFPSGLSPVDVHIIAHSHGSVNPRGRELTKLTIEPGGMHAHAPRGIISWDFRGADPGPPGATPARGGRPCPPGAIAARRGPQLPAGGRNGEISAAYSGRDFPAGGLFVVSTDVIVTIT